MPRKRTRSPETERNDTEVFTDAGHPTRQRLRPALSVFFVYHPADGTVLVKSHLRARDRIVELLQRFGQALGQCRAGEADVAVANPFVALDT